MDPIFLLTKGTLPFINAVVTRLDKDAWHLLKPFEHKVVCFQIDGFSPLYFEIHQEGLQVIQKEPSFHPDVTFSGSFSAFIGMIFSKNRLQHGLHVRGDMDCAKALYDTWRYLDLDWEGYLATFVGGDAANMLSKGFNQWKTWAKDNVDSGIENVGAYLQDETQWLPTQNEIEHFLQEIDKLRLDVDRVEARLSLLQKNYQQR